MVTQLRGLHRRTYEALFRIPVASNLVWEELRSMLVAIADAAEEGSDFVRIKRNGRTLFLRRPLANRMGDVGILMKVRHFLERSTGLTGKPPLERLHLV